MRVAVFRKAHFNAAHRLHVPHWSDEKNRQVFGLCNNPYYHGHNYELEVKVVGEVDPITGMVIDLVDLSHIIKSQVEERLDHKNLNIEVEEFKNINPSAENICYVIWKWIADALEPNKYEVQVRLYETPRNYVEYPV